MSEIEAIGFDYDYTLAVYKKPVNTMIYELALRVLIEDYKYPAAIFEMNYDPTFAIRGLHDRIILNRTIRMTKWVE